MTDLCLSPRPRWHACLLLASALLGSGATVAFGQEYGVTVNVSKPAALANIKTYTYVRGHQAYDKTIDAQIKAAIARELDALGLTRLEAGPADVEVTYYSLSRLDADLKAKTADGRPPLQSVGTLVIDLLSPASREPLFRVRVDQPLDADPVRREQIINDAVAAMFKKFPPRKAK